MKAEQAQSWAALQSSWHKVASTHNLQQLLDEASEPKPRRSAALGLLLLTAAVLGASSLLFACLVSKLLPPFTNPTLRWVQQDCYYCLLLPLTLPATVVAVTLNWFSLKLFKHNS